MMASTTAAAAAAKTVQPFTPTLFEGDLSQETELSPEPSPAVPPAPQQAYYHSNKVLNTAMGMGMKSQISQQTQPDVITPRQTLAYDEKNEYDESELSLSDVPAPPSPYSPPPSSLFSEDDFPPKAAATRNSESQRRRLPLQEVRLGRSSKELQGLSPQQLVPSDNCESTDQRSVEGLLDRHQLLLEEEEDQLADLTTRSHNLLPAVLHLKQNLAESHQSFYLLQQENKALAAECDKVQAQLNYWQTAAETQALEQEEALQETINILTQENQGLQEEKKALEDKIDSLKKVQEQLQETVQNTESLQQQVESLTSQCEQVSLSNQTLQEENDRLSQQVLAAQARAGGAQAEQERLQQTLQELQSEIRSLRTKLKEVTATWSQRVDTMKKQHEEAQSCLVQENTSQRLEIDKCKAMLKEAGRNHRKELQTATCKASDLQDEMDRLDAALKESEASNNTLCAENKALQCELEHQRKQQQQQHDVVDAVCQTDTPKQAEVSTQTMQNIPHQIGMDTTSSPEAAASTGINEVTVAAVESSSTNNNSITERLGRIRDAAERATWMQDYRREISRLKAEHQTELRRLEEIHDESLRRVINEAKLEMNTRTKEYKRFVKQEYEGRVASLERKQQEELKRTKREYEAKIAATEQAMKEAASELSLTTKQVERAVSERQDLEQRVLELERQLQEKDQKRTVDHEERKSLRKEWEDETNALLAAIREECNAVFDRRKQPTRRTSPRSVLIEPILEPTNGLSQDATTQPAFVHRPQPRRRSTSVSSTPPPSTSYHSNLDQALQETEALVQKLLENEMNE